MSDEIIVGMGRLFVVDKPVILSGIGLGSCIGLMLYDETTSIAGFAHIMLPDSSKARFVESNNTSLMADFEESVIKTAQELFPKFGLSLAGVAMDCDEAIKKYQETSPGFLFINSHIPPDSADCVLDKVFEIDHSANVVVTGIHNDTDYISYYSKGIIDVIRHPVTRKRFEFTLDFVNSLKFMRFADIAIEKMLLKMIDMGCKKENIKAKFAGGAHMFNHSQVKIRNIGEENSEAVMRLLKEHAIPVVAKEYGGEIGRTVRFDASRFIATITSREGEREL